MRRLLLLLAICTACSAAALAQDTTAPVCGVNNNGANIVPSGASVTKINGTTTVSWHDFVTQTLAVGDYWTDLAYGCFAKMLTNSAVVGGAQSHQYALSTALDSGDCYVMAQNPDSGNSSQFVIAAPTASCTGGFGTWGQTVLSSAQMPARTSHNEFVWDYFTQGKFWFANNNTIGECTITGIGTTSCATKHTFSEYSSGGCNIIDYAAMNQNGFIDTICLTGAATVMDIFMYDTVHDVKSAVYTTACTGSLTSNQPGCIHKIAITPNNGILVQFTGGGAGNEIGNHYWQYPTPSNPMPQIEKLTDHVDVAADFTTTTTDRGFFEDFQDNPGPWTGCQFGFKPTSTTLPLSGNPLCVFDQSNTANFNAGWDISTRAWPARAWILYSMQDGSNNTTVSPATNCNTSGSYADPSTSNWSNNGVGRLENELLLVRADVGGNFAKIWRLGLTHQRGPCASNNFYADPRAAQSVDGKYIVFDTNARWGNAGGGPGSQVDIVVMGGSINSGVLGPLFGSSAPPIVTITPSPIAFGSRQVNTVGPVVTVTVSNTGGSTLTLSTPFLSITGVNPTDFVNTGAGTCVNAGSVVAGGSCTVTMTYNPTVIGQESAVFNISGNVNGSANMTGSSTGGTLQMKGSGTLSGKATVVINP